MTSSAPLITVSSERLSGTPVFARTRGPLREAFATGELLPGSLLLTRAGVCWA